MFGGAAYLHSTGNNIFQLATNIVLREVLSKEHLCCSTGNLSYNKVLLTFVLPIQTSTIPDLW
eukprot:m.889711 g.889711  ORF g.889711 m.889711 type:complete len:63 (-) comp23646_c0_seq11:2706-2894(-)